MRGRRGARLLAQTSGGAIPEVADYRVVLDPDETFVGTLNEDFAIESKAGDVFQLGNASWQILQVDGRHRPRRRRARGRRRRFRSGSAKRRRAATSCRARSAICAPRSTRAARRRRSRHGRSLVRLTSTGWSSETGADARRPRRRLSRTSPRGGARSASSRRRRRWCSSGSSTSPAACSSCCTRRSAAASTRRGAWRCASASAASSTSSCRRRRPRTRCCCRSARSTRFRCGRVPLPASRDDARRAGAGVPRRAGVQDALALEHDHLAGRAAQPRRPQGRAAAAADARRRSDGGGVPRRGGLPREHSRRSPDSRSSAGQPDRARLPAGGDGLRRPARACSSAFIAASCGWSRATRPSRRCSRTTSSTPSRTPSWTTRRSRSGGRTRCRRGAPATAASAGDLGALDAAAIARVREEARPDPRDADELHDALMTAGLLTASEAGRRRPAWIDT